MKKFFDLQRFVKTVKLTAKADNYENEAEKVKILALGGNDTIKNNSFADNVTIDGGAGIDSIENFGSSVSIAGGAGNDSISNYGNYVTLVGGKGNDYIGMGYNGNNVVKYSSGDGNDYINGFTSSDTLYIAKGSYSTMISDNNFIVKVGKQQITLEYAALNEYDKVIIKDSSGKVAVYNDWKIMNGTNGKDNLYNSANNVTVNGNAGNDYISNDGGNNVTITGGTGNDTIWSFGKNSNIFGNAGNDTIHTGGSDSVTVSGGDGKDYIDTFGDDCIIDGGAGNDTVDGSYLADNLTVTGGKGNDSIKLGDENNVIKYANGDGNDIIKYFDSNDTLHITKGSYKVSTKGDDVIVTVGKGKITLKDAAGTSISIKDSKGKVSTKTYGSASSALFAEDNFATADNLDAIVENKLTATDYKLATNNFENLIQENNLITFSEK